MQDLVLWTVLGLVGVWLVLYVIGLFNSGIGMLRGLDQSFGNIDSVLKQRYEELPKLVNACEAYMQHERGLLAEVTRLRGAYDEARTTDEKVRVENTLSAQLGQLRVSAEAYPALRANELFLQTTGRITGLETTLNDRREQFNQAVTAYNIFIEQFPARLFVGLFGFKPRTVLVTPQAQRQDPTLFSVRSA